MPSHRPAVIVAVVVACLMPPARVGAQTIPQLELAGGVGVLYSTELFKYVVPADWLASAGWNVGNSLTTVVGEFARLPPARHGISTHDIYTTTYPCETVPVQFVSPGFRCPASGTVDITGPGTGERAVDMHAFLFGPRITLRSARLKPFVHVLVGAARVTWEATLDELPPDTVRTGQGEEGDLDAHGPLSSQSWSMAFQVGIGVNIPLRERLTARFAADGRRLVGEPLFTSQFRLSAQLVVGLGTQ